MKGDGLVTGAKHEVVCGVTVPGGRGGQRMCLWGPGAARPLSAAGCSVQSLGDSWTQRRWRQIAFGPAFPVVLKIHVTLEKRAPKGTMRVHRRMLSALHISGLSGASCPPPSLGENFCPRPGASQTSPTARTPVTQEQRGVTFDSPVHGVGCELAMWSPVSANREKGVLEFRLGSGA